MLMESGLTSSNDRVVNRNNNRSRCPIISIDIMSDCVLGGVITDQMNREAMKIGINILQAVCSFKNFK